MTISLSRNPHVNRIINPERVPATAAAVWDIPAPARSGHTIQGVRTLTRDVRTQVPAEVKAKTAGRGRSTVEQRREVGRTLLAGAVAGFVLVVGVTIGMDPEPAGQPETITAVTLR